MPSTPSDITLAVGDGARRMTYAELAAVRGIYQPRRSAAFPVWPRGRGSRHHQRLGGDRQRRKKLEALVG
jgi:hypothetical protein